MCYAMLLCNRNFLFNFVIESVSVESGCQVKTMHAIPNFY